MCGIAGIVDFEGRPVEAGVLRAATDLLRHRGPDDDGFWIEHRDGTAVGLGFRRLAVIDPGPRGAQPMRNTACAAAGRAAPLTLVFNGEIYNYRELRRDLEARGHRFTTGTDSEVILHLYEDLGRDLVPRLRGMFAFAVWDAHARRLFCARDRTGQKPLYYRQSGSRFWFASEPRAILADPAVPAAVDLPAIRAYLTLGYVPADRSAFAGLRRLLPGHWISVDRGGARRERYWTLRYGPKTRQSEAEAARGLRARLEDSVRLRLRSDVPVGAFLSGGVDSSTVVALMHRAGARVRTFSIGFEDAAYDELPYARRVAARYSDEHHELVVRPDAAALAPRLAWHYGEPYADSSAVPTWRLAQFARRRVTVALTGDGGDESFAGYRRYLIHLALRRCRRLPAAVRRALAGVAARWPAAASTGRGWRSDLDRIARVVAGAGHPDHEWYAGVRGFFDAGGGDLAPSFRETADRTVLDAMAQAFADRRTLHPIDAVMGVDVALYLPDDLLVKVDIATMAQGLEARSPLLDHEVMEYAARLPVRQKMRRLRLKSLLRRVCADLVPAEVLARPKAGFSVPLDRWFRTDLADAARDTLLAPGARVHDYVRQAVVARLIDEHLAGRAAHGHRLWALYMLELWHRICLARPGAPAPAEAPPAAARVAAPGRTAA